MPSNGERGIVDATRQGGMGNAAPKDTRGIAAPEMTFAEAELWYKKLFDWRTIPTKNQQAMNAMLNEVWLERQRKEEWRKEAKEQAEAVLQALNDVAQLRAALPDIIGCSRGDPATCTQDNHGWSPCCRARLAAVWYGLLATARVEEVEDGA